MELIVAYFACVLLGLTGARLAVLEAYHTIMDHRHAACLQRTAVLEIELGMRDAPLPETRRPRRSPQSASDRWMASVQEAARAKQANYSQGRKTLSQVVSSWKPPASKSLDASGNEGDPDSLPYPYCGPGN